jgi:FAD/FMN-containing dehydrogenase
MNADTAAKLKSLLGPKGFIEDPAEITPHLEEWRGKYHGRTSVMLRPASTADVSAILRICHETNTPVVPQGGNTGLVGGQLPFDGEILLDLSRLRAIRALDKDGASITLEAGVILAEAQKAADDAGLMLPLSMASEGSCMAGGFLSTNAGGVNVLRYGMAREQTLGLEVVLADGTVLDLLRTLRKDNTGYDLKQLFIGAEGTLGVITAAALKLFPKPEMQCTAFLAAPDVASALKILSRLQGATGGSVGAFELTPRYGMELVTKHIPGASDPFAAPSPWYVLCEVSGTPMLKDVFEETLGAALEDGLASDAVIAASEAQRMALWKLRESLSEAEKLEGPSFKHDVAVPVSAQAEFIDKAVAAVARAEPGIKPMVFGHLGDGNLHFNFMIPRARADLLDRWDEIAAVVYQVVREFRGTISAEHGIGVMKRAELARSKSPEEIALMRLLKRTLDPKNILNPGKLLPED